MRTVTTVHDLRAAVLRARGEGRTIGLVPTMGALHAGHCSLIAAAREGTDLVVVSLFVNPAQFAPTEDLAAYPRDLAGDAAQAAAVGADLLFAPSVEEVYPPGFATTVSVTGALTETLEGAGRGRGHFDGVATVVAKLLGMAAPDRAYFGQKDAQQAAVIRRLVRDLDLGVVIEVLPTVREADGLAMSSRNAYLDGPDRTRAVALIEALRAAEAGVASGESATATVRAAATAALRARAVEPEYLAFVDPESFSPVDRIDRPTLALVAARVGPARLIDNLLLTPNGARTP